MALKPQLPPPPQTRQDSPRLHVLTWQGSDAELVDSLLAGTPSAAAALHDRFAPDINRVVYRVLGGDTEHDDVVHDIFIKVWALIRQGKVRKPDSLRSWVFGVATHCVYKELRRRYIRRKFLRLEEQAPERLAAVGDPDARDLLLTMHRILTELPPAERLAFSLRHLDHRRLLEVAEMCGCSLATVKRRLTRAEARFRVRAAPYPALVSLLDAEDGR